MFRLYGAASYTSRSAISVCTERNAQCDITYLSSIFDLKCDVTYFAKICKVLCAYFRFHRMSTDNTSNKCACHVR